MDKKNQGFTLIELLIVIGIIAILAAAVIITVTPGERLQEARNATRASHMTAIGSAFHLTAVDQGNSLTSIADIIGHADCGSGTVTALRDFSNSCATLVGLGSTAPVDPQSGSYRVRATSGGTDSRLEIQTPSTISDDQVTETF
jgi:prepilin-type N-terminal cleavage/methylation domain-containing protein